MPTDWIFVSEISLLNRVLFLKYPYWLNFLYQTNIFFRLSVYFWNIPTDWIFGSETFLLTELIVLKCLIPFEPEGGQGLDECSKTCHGKGPGREGQTRSRRKKTEGRWTVEVLNYPFLAVKKILKYGVLNIRSGWIWCTGIFVLAEYSVLKYPLWLNQYIVM